MKDMEKLTTFSPALVYGLIPKASRQALAGSDSFQDTLFHSVMQYEDLLKGYLYAETDILPKLKSVGSDKITSEQLLAWIMVLHQKISKHLLDVWSRESGVYSDEAILRWHHGSLISYHLIQYFSNHHECKKASKMASFLATAFGVKEKNAFLFIQLSEKINRDASIPVFQFQQTHKQDVDKKFQRGISVLHKLYAAISLNRLNPDEKMISDLFVEACLIPEEIPKAMKVYADNTLRKFYACNASDLEQVSSFLADSFYELIKIHPFSKGNGRVATCLMNIFLKALGWPNILLCHPDEHGKEEKAYLEAVEQIAVSRESLQKLIIAKIITAEEKPIIDKTYGQLITLRIALVELCRSILAKFPSFDVDKLKRQVYTSASFKAIFQTQAHPHHVSCLAIQYLTKMFLEAERNLEQISHQNPPQLFFSKDKLTQVQGDDLKSHFFKLTSQLGWKINKPKGVLWLELLDSTVANEVFHRLKPLAIGEISLKKMAGKEEISVVMCEKIDMERLASMSLWVEKESMAPDTNL